MDAEEQLAYLKNLINENPALTPDQIQVKQAFLEDIFRGTIDIAASGAGRYIPLRRFKPGGKYASFGLASHRYDTVFYCTASPLADEAAFAAKLELPISQLFAKAAGGEDADKVTALVQEVSEVAHVSISSLRETRLANLGSQHFETADRRNRFLDTVCAFCQQTMRR